MIRLQFIDHIICLFDFLSVNGRTMCFGKKKEENCCMRLCHNKIFLFGGINEVKFLICLHIQIKYYHKQTICWFSLTFMRGLCNAC